MKEGDCVLVIIGNKIDLERQRTVTQKEAEDYAATVGAQHFHTSAKLNKGLEETFVGLTRRMMEVTNLLFFSPPLLSFDQVFPEGGAAKKSMALSGAGPGVDEGASTGAAKSECGC